MRMPGESQAEFLLLQPMVPTDRPNMIAWVAARNDAPNYGTTRVYRFPAETTVFGPAQIEARIDQDPIISQQVTLWNQSGQLGHPRQPDRRAARRFDHLPPAGLPEVDQRRRSREFQRIVVASTRNVVWGPTLSSAIDLLLARRGAGEPVAVADADAVAEPGAPRRPRPRRPGRPASPGTIEPLPNDVPGLIAYANRHYDLAQAALRAGDFAGYGARDRDGQGGARQARPAGPERRPAVAPSASPAQ